MYNSLYEISNVINNIFISSDRSVLEKEVKRTFTPDLEFKHFLVTVPAGIGSREKVMAIYKFYRGECYLYVKEKSIYTEDITFLHSFIPLLFIGIYLSNRIDIHEKCKFFF